jgi:hypothetical protein
MKARHWPCLSVYVFFVGNLFSRPSLGKSA